MIYALSPVAALLIGVAILLTGQALQGILVPVRAEQVTINEWYAGDVETPFGGYGKSGFGREKGREALMNYVQTRNIGVALRPHPATSQQRCSTIHG